jgi:hypothetical protein
MSDVLSVLKELGTGIFRTLWALAIILVCVFLTLIAVIFNLFNVAVNQKATIENQKAIALASDERTTAGRALVTKALQVINKVSDDMDRLTVLYLVQWRDLESQRAPLAEIIRGEGQLIEQQKATIAKAEEVLRAAQISASEARAAAAQTRNTNRTIKEKVVTTPEKLDVEKQKQKLAAKTQAIDVKSQKLNTLVNQYKQAIKKADH